MEPLQFSPVVQMNSSLKKIVINHLQYCSLKIVWQNFNQILATCMTILSEVTTLLKYKLHSEHTNSSFDWHNLAHFPCIISHDKLFLATGLSLNNGLSVRFLVRSGIRRIQIQKDKCLFLLKHSKHATKKTVLSPGSGCFKYNIF